MKKIFVLGSINVDLVIESDRIPNEGETIYGRNFLTNIGGKGFNQTIAVSKNCDAAYFLGSVGNTYMSEIKHILDQSNILTNFVDYSNLMPTGTAIILLTHGDNRIIIDKGANGLIKKETIDKAFDFAEPGDYLLSQLEINSELIEYAFSKAKQKQLVTVLNTAPAKILSKDIFKHTDYLILNQTEAKFYSEIYPNSENLAKNSAVKLLDLGPEKVLITLGETGSYYASNQFSYFQSAYYTDNVVDSTAAGDTFVGYFLSMMAKGSSIKTSMKYASAASTLSISKKGAQKSIPSMIDVEMFLRLQNDKKESNG